MSASRNNSISAQSAARVGSVTAQDLNHAVPVKADVANDAARAAENEQSMTLKEGFKIYPKAVAWSLLLSTCIIMDGFDIVLVNNLFALPAFTRKFGTEISPGNWQVSAAWQSGLANGALIGEIFGLFLVGYLAERFGYRKTLIGALTGAIGFVFLLFFATGLPMLLVGEMLCGVAWGAFQTLTTTYAAEVCPVPLRAYLTTYVNLCWVIGQFFSSGVLKGVSDMTSVWGYKIPYGLQWIWPVPLIVGIALAPESPWWLVRRGRKEEAKKSILRLTTRNQPGFNMDDTLQMMVYTTELEKANTEGASWWDCFKGANLRRTEITCLVWMIQVPTAALGGWSTYFYEQAGLSSSHAFTLALVGYSLGALGVFASWFLISRAGRRSLYLSGEIAVIVCYLVIGLLGIAPTSSSAVQWVIGAMLMISTFAYDATIGPVCYSLVAEIPSTRLRNKTVVLARNSYNIASIISNILTTHMLNPSSFGWGAKTALFYGGLAVLCLIWTFFRLPEPKGRTYAELDVLFETNVSARKFKDTIVDAFAHSTNAAQFDDSTSTKKHVVVQVEDLESMHSEKQS